MHAQLDYLRLGTYDSAAYWYLAGKINKRALTKPGRWLQYNGRRAADEGIFYGHGEQNGRHHHIVQFSGPAASQYLQDIFDSDLAGEFYCTRLDVQVTIKEPTEHDGRDLLYNRVNKKNKSIVQSPGCTTVYIGARSSHLFTRVYEKIVDARYLRCEFELKGPYAKNAWAELYEKRAGHNALFTACLERVKLPTPYSDWFELESDHSEQLNSEQEEKDLESMLTYLRNTEIALTRLLYQHSTHEATMELIEGLERIRNQLT